MVKEIFQEDCLAALTMQKPLRIRAIGREAGTVSDRLRKAPRRPTKRKASQRHFKEEGLAALGQRGHVSHGHRRG